ncbi:hypothetical protein [Planococcus shixiaomingii]|uniref:hypothetical protein n=1 Tax=Planococcus shixiaomingii TaxID=3058393 RepID=UPI0026238AB7|nr:hypothetical protein [Planococcus sp. N022]WKA53605.1 hypothetical protein QWY21_13155 [Planococcus sp. N022]
MNVNLKLMATKSVLLVFLAGVFLNVGAGNVFAQDAAASADFLTYEAQLHEQDTKYSKKVMKAVRESLGTAAKSIQLNSVIETMPKVQVMDHYLTSFGDKIKGNEVRRAVEDVFYIDLSYISKMDYGSKLAIYPNNVMESLRISFDEKATSTTKDADIMKLAKNEVMDRYIKVHGYSLTGAEARKLINQIFGVNLDGISTLEHSQLAINSKGQWILKSDTDLFILESSLDDVDVSVYATEYFEELTGSKQLPDSLKSKLINMGFTYNESTELLYYKNPANESVPDAFKGQVLGTIVGTIITEYKN